MSRLAALHTVLAVRRPVEGSGASRRETAVAVILVPSPDRVLLIARADRPGDPWSGHLACPGGRREQADASLLATAIRETREEVGIQLEPIPTPIQLDDLTPTIRAVPALVVRPFVFVLSATPTLATNHEVAGFRWIELAQLARRDARRETELTIGGVARRVAGYPLEHGLLWGITEQIVTPVVRAWQGLADGDR